MVESCGALPANLGGWRQLRVWATGGRYRRDPRRLPVAEEWPRPAFIRKTQKNQSIVERERERLIRCEKGKRNDIVSLLSPEEMMGPAIIIHWKKRRKRPDAVAYIPDANWLPIPSSRRGFSCTITTRNQGGATDYRSTQRYIFSSFFSTETEVKLIDQQPVRLRS